jgi:methyltransferase
MSALDPRLALGAVLLLIVGQRLSELRLARRNEARARAEGAVEHGAGHYPLFFVLHTGWLLAWPIEAWWTGGSGPRFGALAALWAGVFVAAEGLRYWAIGSLGWRWNTRILVLPGLAPIAAGPYRWIRHPNYLAVVLELAAVPLIFDAVWVSGVASVLNAALLLGVRIPAEERALREASVGSSPA